MAETQGSRPKPLLRIRSHFSPLLVVSHHPVRLAVSLAIPFMLLPELRKFVQAHWALGIEEARLASVLGILAVVFLPELLVSALNCRKVVFAFYEDRVEFTESFLVREVIRLSYASIAGVSLRTGLIQRLAGVSDILLVQRGRVGAKGGGQSLQQVIPDVRNAAALAAEIEKIVKARQAAAPRD